LRKRRYARSSLQSAWNLKFALKKPLVKVAFLKGLSTLKGVATGIANTCSATVTYLNFTGRAGIIFGVVNTVFYITANTVICFAVTIVFHIKYPF
jgi:hypothetical protein